MPSLSKIVHIDMDAFFASVEQLDNSELRGLPVIVGGSPDGRGVVAACSYEARRFGIHSAMPCSRAYRLCPKARFIQPHLERYEQVSNIIMSIFKRFTDLVEPLSFDEAYLDLTYNKQEISSATQAARCIRATVKRETGLTCSAGVSFNKFLAKIASDMNKPDGLTVIMPDQALKLIHSLEIRKFHGIGRVTEQRMHKLGIRTGADLQRFSEQELIRHFGKIGTYFYQIVRGIDDRPVQPERKRKSFGAESTLHKDTSDRDTMLSVLTGLTHQVIDRMKKETTTARTLTLKVRFHDFITTTRSFTSSTPFTEAKDINVHLLRLLASTEAGKKKVRLLGIRLTNLHNQTLSSINFQTNIPQQILLPFGSREELPD